LKRRLAAPQLRAAIADGSISDLVQWRRALKDDVIFVPAGTIHAIGAGIVLAEIQQRSDATFRLFDHGRQREIHVDDAVAAAHAGPAQRQSASRRLTDARTLLVASPHFVLERVDLAAGSNWELQAEPETWVLVLEGQARVGQTNAMAGEAVFLEADCATVEVGSDGLKGLLAYAAAEPNPSLLRHLGRRRAEIPQSGRPPLPAHPRAAPGSPIVSREVRP
jgi:mannose-6-phosphate isomerase